MAGEQRQINTMCALFGKPRLFNREFTEEHRPTDFAFLIRPTLKEFNGFVLLLDQMIADNINYEFFSGDIERDFFETRSDGALVARQKGSLMMLEEWVTRNFRPKDPAPMTEMFATFRRIRRLRQNPAHKVLDNEFEQGYFKSQRELIISTYEALRLLRLVIANHPAARSHRVPDWLNGTIYTH